MSDAGSAFGGSPAGSFGTTRAPGLRPRQRVFQKFVLINLLGRGAMGIVWRARDEEMRTDRALKFLPQIFARDDTAFQQLVRETSNCINLSHPHIVRVYDLLRDDQQMAAIPMEFVDGLNLSARLGSHSRAFFEPGEIAEWVRQLCEALQYAHNDAPTTVVHRDLKPANLMVNSKDQLKLTDFGLASRLAASGVLPTGVQVGTLLYMSPQQLCGAEPTPQDDIYSLGATLYELLTSKPPFYSGDINTQIRDIRPARIGERRAQLGLQGEPIPPEWEDVIQACLEKNPARRPTCAQEVWDRLASLGEGEEKPYHPPRIPDADQPRDVEVVAGQSATFSVHAEAAPAPTYQWQRDGADIPGAHSPSYTIGNAQRSHGGAYACRVSNDLGSTVSLEARLTVRAPVAPSGSPPQIHTHPADAEARVGDCISFSVSASGTPPPTYQWCLDGADVPGATRSSYEIRSVREDAAGEYCVRVQNERGTEFSQAARLTVLPVRQAPTRPPADPPKSQPPTIEEHPNEVISQRGGNAKFTVIATGSQPLRYQWHHDGEDIRGATKATLLLRDIRNDETGEYTVEVSNDAGSVTSEPATLKLKRTGGGVSKPLVMFGGLGILALGLIVLGVMKNRSKDGTKEPTPATNTTSIVGGGTNVVRAPITPPLTNPVARTGLIIRAGKQAVSYQISGGGTGGLAPQESVTNDLPAGDYTLTVSRVAGSSAFKHDPQQLPVTVEDGKLAVKTPSDFPEGSLDIKSTPPGLPFQLNGPSSAPPVTGTTPAKYSNLPTGNYRVSITHAGTAPFSKDLTIARGTEEAVFWMVPNAPPPAVGSFVITTDPPGAAAAIFGLPAQTTPTTFRGLPASTYRVSLTLAGHQPLIADVVVKAGVTTNLPPYKLKRLPPPPGRLNISVLPSDALVKVDGRRWEPNTILDFPDEPPREVRLTAELTGYQPQATNLTVGAGLDRRVQWQLNRLPPVPRDGLLNLTVTPPNAEVMVDGMVEPRRSLPFNNKKPQTITLLAKLEGYESHTTTVIVGAGLTNNIALVLKPRSPPPEPKPPAHGTKQWQNSLGMEFVAVPGVGGLMCVHETRAQDYQVFAKEKELSWPPPEARPSPGGHPAVHITWEGARDFCAWLTEREKKAGTISAMQRYRLPTDREWSAAIGLTNEDGNKPSDRGKKAIVGTSSGGLFSSPEWDAPWGRVKAVDRPPREAGNYAASVKVDDFPITAPVKSFKPNQFGVYDLGGNAWEWCEDLFDTAEGVHVMRGGSWKTELLLNARPYTHHMLSGMRFPGAIATDDTGFRVVLDLGR